MKFKCKSTKGILKLRIQNFSLIGHSTNREFNIELCRKLDIYATFTFNLKSSISKDLSQCSKQPFIKKRIQISESVPLEFCSPTDTHTQAAVKIKILMILWRCKKYPTNKRKVLIKRKVFICCSYFHYVSNFTM